MGRVSVVGILVIGTLLPVGTSVAGAGRAVSSRAGKGDEVAAVLRTRIAWLAGRKDSALGMIPALMGELAVEPYLLGNGRAVLADGIGNSFFGGTVFNSGLNDFSVIEGKMFTVMCSKIIHGGYPPK